MLNRSNLFLFLCVLLIVSSVVADPPAAPESSRTVVETQPTVVKKVAVRPIAATESIDWRLEGSNRPQTSSVHATAAPINPESVRMGTPAPQMAPTPTASTPAVTPEPAQSAAPCQNCGNNGYYGGRHCYFHYWPYGTEPFGMCVCNAMRAQITNGLAAQLVFYRYDFNNNPGEGGSKSPTAANLSPRGWVQMVKIGEMLNRLPVPPVVIESSNDSQLDEARRQNVIAGLTEVMGSPVPPEWVVVGEPMANPLNGEEAVIVHENLLRQTEAAGQYDANDRSSMQGNGNSGSGILGQPTNVNR